MSITDMGRDPEKDERIVIYCSSELKQNWETFAIQYDDAPAALAELLAVAEENPELVGGYID